MKQKQYWKEKQTNPQQEISLWVVHKTSKKKKKTSKGYTRLEQPYKPTGPNWIYITFHYQWYIKFHGHLRNVLHFYERVYFK